MGDWGILHLVCGAFKGQSLSGQFSVVEGLGSQTEAMLKYLNKEKNPEQVALMSKFTMSTTLCVNIQV
ncbi:hypothetical protein LGK95_03630 [Clostridium algoriphilum]|uniref:hypothetical protein n=1 Tax=Clostridium algoriphilum TaxID=198347 RepID=UPI001CF4D7CF|nr:hypothetical protein [Clostridium algoriphilum]MCB2292627.1 hypothetical protein [Clostridium algoriphilum]